MASNIIEPSDLSGEEGGGLAGLRVTTRKEFTVSVVESWSPFFRSSKFFQFRAALGMRGALSTLQELYLGPGSMWELDSGALGRVMTKLVSDNLDMPLLVEVRKRVGNKVNFHITAGNIQILFPSSTCHITCFLGGPTVIVLV